MKKSKDNVYQIVNTFDFGATPRKVETDDPKRFIVEYSAKVNNIKDVEKYVKENLSEVSVYKDTYTFDEFALDRPRKKRSTPKNKKA
jgi:hypothetical protein